MRRFLFAVSFVALVLATGVQASLIVVTDASQLDFSGDFQYAVNFNGSGATTIGDAVFTNVALNGSGLPTGLSFSGFDNIKYVWGAQNIGSGADNDGLENVMKSIVFGGGVPGSVDAAVNVGSKYRVQLLFSEQRANDRHFDVVFESSVLEEIKGVDFGGDWRASQTQGYALQYDFTATDGNLDIDFTRQTTGDTNYVLSGLTVETLPEPSILVLLGLGLFGLRKRIQRGAASQH